MKSMSRVNIASQFRSIERKPQMSSLDFCSTFPELAEILQCLNNICKKDEHASGSDMSPRSRYVCS